MSSSKAVRAALVLAACSLLATAWQGWQLHLTRRQFAQWQTQQQRDTGQWQDQTRDYQTETKRLTNELAGIQSRLAEVQKRAEALEALASAQKQAITGLQDAMDKVKKDSGAADIDMIEKLAALTSRTTEIEGRMTATAATITALQEQAGLLQDGLDSARRSIASLISGLQAVEELSKKLDFLEARLNAHLALTIPPR